MNCRRKEVPTVVPWMSGQEFDWVKAALFSDDNDSIREAYERILVWQARLGTKTPIAIECTINLIEAKLADNGQLKESYLAKLFSLALVRSVSLITHTMQSGGVITPMQVLASKSGIPEWIVQFRHDTSHSVGAPPFRLAKAGVCFMISWLKDNFWDVYIPPVLSVQDEPLDYSADDDIRDLLIVYQQQQFRSFVSRNGPIKKLKKTLDKLTNRLRTEDSRCTLCSVLVQDGFLIPTMNQLAALGISEEVPPTEDVSTSQEFPFLDDNILQFWQAIIIIVARCQKLTQLVGALVTRLCRLSDGEGNITADVILGWINEICRTVFQSNKSNPGFLSSDEISRNVLDSAWYSVIVLCVAEVNRYTQAALKVLLQTAGRNLPNSTKENLLELVSFSSDTLDFGLGEDGMDVDEDLLGERDFLDLSEKKASVEDEDVNQIRGQHCQPWCLAPESVNWGLYPVGVLPGQSRDPCYFNLLSKEIGRTNSSKSRLPEKESAQQDERRQTPSKHQAESEQSHWNEKMFSSPVSLRLRALNADDITYL